MDQRTLQISDALIAIFRLVNDRCQPRTVEAELQKVFHLPPRALQVLKTFLKIVILLVPFFRLYPTKWSPDWSYYNMVTSWSPYHCDNLFVIFSHC